MVDHVQIGDTTPREWFEVTAGQKDFQFFFPYFDETDIEVAVDDVTQSPTLYTVSPTTTYEGGYVGGTVTFNSSPYVDETTVVTVRRRVAVERTSDFQESGEFRAKVINDELDILTACVQQVDDDVERSIHLPVSDPTGTITKLPDVAGRKNKALIFSDTGDVTVSTEDFETQAANAQAWAEKAQKWAEEVENTEVETGKYSALHHSAKAAAQEAKAQLWAEEVEDTEVETGKYSALHHSAKAAGQEAKAQKWAEEVEDTEVETGKYSALHHSAKAATQEAKAQLWAEEVEDTEVETGKYSALHHSAKAAAEKDKAQKWAEEAEDSEVETGKYSALHHSAKAAASAAAAAASASSNMYKTVVDKSANYTVVLDDDGALIRVDTTSGPVTITLPLVSSAGDGFRVAIAKWSDDGNQIIVSRSGTDTINGASSYAISQRFESAVFVSDDVSGTDLWYASGAGASQAEVTTDTFVDGAGFTAGTTTQVTLSGQPLVEDNVTVTFDGVVQHRSTWSLSNDVITFTSAIPVGTQEVEATWGSTTEIGAPSDNTVTTSKLVDGAVTVAKLVDAAKCFDIPFQAGFGADFAGADLAADQIHSEMVLSRNLTVEGEQGYIDTPSAGQAVEVDVLVNGTTIYSTRPQFAAAANALTAGTLSTTSLTAGDRLTFKVAQVGTTTVGQKLRFTLKARLS